MFDPITSGILIFIVFLIETKNKGVVDMYFVVDIITREMHSLHDKQYAEIKDFKMKYYIKESPEIFNLNIEYKLKEWGFVK